MVNKVFAKKLLFIAMTFIILICTSGCGEDEEGVYKSETKALLKLSNEIKKSGEAFISSDKEERDLLIKLHKAYYEGKAGYDKARDKGYKIAEIKFKGWSSNSMRFNLLSFNMISINSIISKLLNEYVFKSKIL